jgi:hypothetical protein
VIKKVYISMCPILDGYGIMTAFSFPHTPSCEPRISTERPRYLDTSSGNCSVRGKAGLGGFTTERQPVLRPAVAFSKISFKYR